MQAAVFSSPGEVGGCSQDPSYDRVNVGGCSQHTQEYLPIVINPVLGLSASLLSAIISQRKGEPGMGHGALANRMPSQGLEGAIGLLQVVIG